MGFPEHVLSRYNVQTIRDCAPGKLFDYILSKNVKVGSDVFIIDVDEASSQLFRNTVTSLRAAGCQAPVIAIAHDETTCPLLIRLRAASVSLGVHCYYDDDWEMRLKILWKRSHNMAKLLQRMHIVMIGKAALIAHALHAGYHVFTSDSDITFFQNPLDFLLPGFDMMVIATEIPVDAVEWGGFYFKALPATRFTLNNGIAYYRSTVAMRKFAAGFQAMATASLRDNQDVIRAFLTISFNQLLMDANLTISPARQVASSTPGHNILHYCNTLCALCVWLCVCVCV